MLRSKKCQFTNLGNRDRQRHSPFNGSRGWMLNIHPKREHQQRGKYYAQECLTILPHEAKRIFLSFGVTMSNGMVLTSLKQELKYMHLSTQNETIIESVDDIIITIQNNSPPIAIINEGSPLCHVIYLV